MSITASDRGDMTGEIAKKFAEKGEYPVTKQGVLVLTNGLSGTSPFNSFEVPSEAMLERAFGTKQIPMETLDRVNAITRKYQELDGVEGCKNDRICGLPPWACLIPGLCCLGG
eukprot:2576498-Pyramimonas_sp.AAC.1